MRVRFFGDAALFLAANRDELEQHEAANSLMLGICDRLVRDPPRDAPAPCLASVEVSAGLALAAIMTPPHKLVVYGLGGDLSAAARILVEGLIREGWQVPGVLGSRKAASFVADSWGTATGETCLLEMRQAVYEIRKVETRAPERGRLIQATDQHVPIVARWSYSFQVSIFGEADADSETEAVRSRVESGRVYLWEDGGPVSMAARVRPTKHGVCISGVYTPPELRGRGYATACVGELSRVLLQEGYSFCALFADLSNAAANRVYLKVGYRRICDYDEYAFSQES